jgi:hypothetical protein
MSSFAVFVLLVVIPIWSSAAIMIRWIEAWGESSTTEALACLATPEEMARRIAVLEEVLNADRTRVIHEN